MITNNKIELIDLEAAIRKLEKNARDMKREDPNNPFILDTQSISFVVFDNDYSRDDLKPGFKINYDMNRKMIKDFELYQKNRQVYTTT